MASYVIRNTTSEYAFKVINQASFTVTLADTALNAVTPTGLYISRYYITMNSGNDYVEIGRNGTAVLELHGNEVVNLAAIKFPLYEESGSSVVVTPSNSGHKYTLIMALGKII